MSSNTHLPHPAVDEGPFPRFAGPVEHDPLSKLRLLIHAHVMRAVQRIQQTWNTLKLLMQTFRSKTGSALDYVKLTSKLQVWMPREERFPQISARNTDMMPQRLHAHSYDINLTATALTVDTRGIARCVRAGHRPGLSFQCLWTLPQRSWNIKITFWSLYYAFKKQNCISMHLNCQHLISLHYICWMISNTCF